MAKRRRSKHHNKKSSIRALPLVFAANGILNPFGESTIEKVRTGRYNAAADSILAAFTGFNLSGDFQPRWALQGSVPVVISYFVSRGLDRVFNQQLANLTRRYLGIGVKI